MANIDIYIKPTCPYCIRALGLLKKKGVDYHIINIMQEPERRQEMIDRAGGRSTVPQIFINGKHIGGCDDLHALDAAGQLDGLLQ